MRYRGVLSGGGVVDGHVSGAELGKREGVLIGMANSLSNQQRSPEPFSDGSLAYIFLIVYLSHQGKKWNRLAIGCGI